MIRSIAKFLIQYSYDSASSSNRQDRLPRWLRRWVNSDSQLRNFERGHLRLEGKLISQAGEHIANGLKPTDVAIGQVRINGSSANSMWRSPIVLAAMAAGLVCVLLTGRWLSTQSSSKPFNPNVASAEAQDTSRRLSEKTKGANLLQSTWKATRQLAQKLDQKGNEAANTIAIANQTVREESKWIESIGLESLRFVGQKLPEASVRMLGLNSRGQPIGQP